MAMMVSPEVAKLFQVLTGEEWPDANEDHLRALAAEWAMGAQALGDQLGPGLSAAVHAIRSEWAGEAERAFAARVAPFIEGDNYIAAAAQLFKSLSDYLLKLAQDVEYMKLVSIYSLIALLAEIALAIALSPFTGGASMAWLAARMAIVRFLLQSLLGRLLIQLLQAAVFGIAFQLLIDAAAQATQFAMGTRNEWDTKKTANAAGVGAMGAALAPFMGGLGKVLSAGLTKFLNTYFSKVFGNQWQKKLPEIITDIGTEAFHETLTEALYKYATEGEFEMNPYAATSGAASATGSAIGDGIGKLVFDVKPGPGPGGGSGPGPGNPPPVDTRGNPEGGPGGGGPGPGNGPGNGVGNGPGPGGGPGPGNGSNSGPGNGFNNGPGNGFNNGSGNGFNSGPGNGVNGGPGNGLNGGPGNGFNNGPGNGVNGGPGNGFNSGQGNGGPGNAPGNGQGNTFGNGNGPSGIENQPGGNTVNSPNNPGGLNNPPPSQTPNWTDTIAGPNPPTNSSPVTTPSTLPPPMDQTVTEQPPAVQQSSPGMESPNLPGQEQQNPTQQPPGQESPGQESPSLGQTNPQPPLGQNSPGIDQTNPEVPTQQPPLGQNSPGVDQTNPQLPPPLGSDGMNQPVPPPVGSDGTNQPGLQPVPPPLGSDGTSQPDLGQTSPEAPTQQPSFGQNSPAVDQSNPQLSPPLGSDGASQQPPGLGQTSPEVPTQQPSFGQNSPGVDQSNPQLLPPLGLDQTNPQLPPPPGTDETDSSVTSGQQPEGSTAPPPRTLPLDGNGQQTNLPPSDQDSRPQAVDPLTQQPLSPQPTPEPNQPTQPPPPAMGGQHPPVMGGQNNNTQPTTSTTTQPAPTPQSPSPTLTTPTPKTTPNTTAPTLPPIRPNTPTTKQAAATLGADPITAPAETHELVTNPSHTNPPPVRNLDKGKAPEPKKPEGKTPKDIGEESGNKAPEPKLPETKTPETKVPEMKVPEGKGPKSTGEEGGSQGKGPEPMSPESKTPENTGEQSGSQGKGPEPKLPETKTPEMKGPEGKGPKGIGEESGSKGPEPKQPETRTPEIKGPEGKDPENVGEEGGSQGKGPESKGPELKLPEGKTPEIKGPENSGEQSNSQNNGPESKKPEGKGPEAKLPEAKTPEVKGPEAKGSEGGVQGKGPEGKTPEAKGPENNGEQSSSQGNGQESKQPEGKGPEGKGPEVKGPENNGQQSNSQDNGPESKKPEGKSPEPKGPQDNGEQSTSQQGNGPESKQPDRKGPENNGQQSTSEQPKGPKDKAPESKAPDTKGEQSSQGTGPESKKPEGKSPENKAPESKTQNEIPQGKKPEGKGPESNGEQSNTKDETPQGKKPEGKAPKGPESDTRDPQGEKPEGKGPESSTKDETPQGKKPEGRGSEGNGEQSNTKNETPQGKKPEGKGPESSTKDETPQGKKPEGRGPEGNSEQSNTKDETPQGKKPEGKGPESNGEQSNTKDETPQGKKPEGKGPESNSEQSNTKDETPQGKKPESPNNGEQSNNEDQNNNDTNNPTPTLADIQSAADTARDNVASALGVARAAYNQARGQLPAITRSVREAYGAVLGTNDAVARAQQRLQDANQHHTNLQQQRTDLLGQRSGDGPRPHPATAFTLDNQITDVEAAITNAVRGINTARADLTATQTSNTAAVNAHNDAVNAQNRAIQAVTDAGNAVQTISNQLTIANNAANITDLATANNQLNTAQNAANTANTNRDIAKRAVTTVTDAGTAAKDAAKQGGVEKAITQLSSLPPRSELTIDNLGPLNNVADMLAGITGATPNSVNTQLTNLGPDGLANAINNGKLDITTPAGTVTVDISADLHRPPDSRYAPQHTQPNTTSHDSSSESTNPLTSSTSSSMPLRIPVLFISPIDAAGGAMRPMVYIGGVAKRAQNFNSGTTSSSSTTNQQTYVPTTMSITANRPGQPPATATVDTGLRLPTITRTNVLTPNPVPGPAFTSLTPAPVTVPTSFVPQLGNSPSTAKFLHDNLLTQNNNPAQVDVNGTTVTVTPTAAPTITLVGTTGVDHSHSNSHSNSSSTTRGSDATFGAGLYGGLKGWFVGAFTDFSTGATDGTNPANEHSTSHSTSDTELVYRIDRPMRIGDGDGVRDTVSSTVQVPVPLARSLGLALPPHLTGTQPVNHTNTYYFGKDTITSVNTNDVVRDLSQGLGAPGQAAVADKFGSQNGGRDAIYNAMHGGDQVTWQEGGRTHFLDIYARPVPPATTAPSALTEAGAEDKNADQFRRTYDSKRSARVGVGGAHLFTGTDSPNPNAPKATPEAGLPNPYQGGPTTSGGLPRASITATWEGGHSNKSGYTGKDGRASKYDGDLRDFTGDVEFVTVHRSTKTPNWAQRFFFGDRQLFGPNAEHRFSGPQKSDIDNVLAGNPSGHADLNTITVNNAIDVSTASDKLEWATRPLPNSTMNPGIYLGTPPAAPPKIDASGLGDYTNVEHVYVTPNTTEGVYLAMAKRVEAAPGTTPSATRTPPSGSGNWSTWGQQQFTESRTNPDGTPKTYTYKNSELTRPGTTSNDAVRDFVGQAGSRGTATQGIGGSQKSTGRMVQTGRLTDFNGELKANVDYSSPKLIDIRPNGTLKRNQAGDHVTGSTKSNAIGIDAEISLGYASKRDGTVGALLRGVFGGGWKGGNSHAVDMTSGAKHAYEYKGPTAFVALDARYTYEADMNIRNVIKTKPFTPLPVTVDQPNGVVVEMPVAHAIDLFTTLGMPVPPDLAGALPDARPPIANPAQTLLNNNGYSSYSDTTVVNASMTDPTNQIGTTLDTLGVTSNKWRADIIGQVDKMLNSPSGHVWLKDVLVGGQGYGGVISVPNSNIGLEDVVDIRVTATESNRPHTDPSARPIVPDKQSNADYVSSSVQDKKSNAWNVAAAVEVGFNSRQVPSVPPGQPDANGNVQQAQPNAGASSGSFTPQVFGGSKAWKTDEILPSSGSDKVNTQVDTDKVGRTGHEVDYQLTFSRRRVPMPVFDTPLLGVPSQFDMNRTAPPVTLQGSVDLLSPGADASPPLTRPANGPTFDVLPGRPPRPAPMFDPTGGWRVESIGAGTAKAIHDALYAQLGNQKLPTGSVQPNRIDTAANTPSSYTRPGGNSEYVAHTMTKGSSLHSGSNAIFTGDKYHSENVIGGKNTFHDKLFDYGLTADFQPGSFRFVQALPDGTEMNLSQEHETGNPQGTTTTVSTSYGPSLPFFGGATSNTGAAGPTTVGTGPPVSENITNDVTTATSSKTGGTDGVKYTGRSYLFLANADFYSDVTRKGSNWTHSAVESVRNVFTNRPDAHTVVKIGSQDDLHVRVWEQEALDKGLITISDVWQHGGKPAPAGFTVTGDPSGGVFHPTGNPAPAPVAVPPNAPPGRTLHVAPGVDVQNVRDFVATLPRDMRPTTYTVDPTSTLTPDAIHAAVDGLPDPPPATTTTTTTTSSSSNTNTDTPQPLPESSRGKGPDDSSNSAPGDQKGKGPANHQDTQSQQPKGPADQSSGTSQVRDPHDPVWEAQVDDAREVLTNLPRDTQQQLFQDASKIVSGGHQTVLFIERPTAEQVAQQELLDQIREIVMLDLHQNGPESAQETSKDLGKEFGTTRTSGLPGGAPQPTPAPVGESSGSSHVDVDLGEFLNLQMFQQPTESQPQTIDPRALQPQPVTQPQTTPPQQSGTTTLAKANEFYDQLATATFNHSAHGPLPIPTQHPEDGCYIRAHLWSQQLREWGVDVKKVFIGRSGPQLLTQSENAFGATKGNPRPVNWDYHVAPLITIDLGNDGPPLEVVLDPAMGKGVVPVRKWIEMAGVTTGFDEADLYDAKPYGKENPLGPNETRLTITDAHAMSPPWLNGAFPASFDEATTLVQAWQDRTREYSIEATERQQFRDWHTALPDDARGRFNTLNDQMNDTSRRNFHNWFRSLSQQERADFADTLGNADTTVADLTPDWDHRVDSARTSLGKLNEDSYNAARKAAGDIVILHHTYPPAGDPRWALIDKITDMVAHRHHTEGYDKAYELSQRLAAEHGTTLATVGDAMNLDNIDWLAGFDANAVAPIPVTGDTSATVPAVPWDTTAPTDLSWLAFDPNDLTGLTFDPNDLAAFTFDPNDLSGLGMDPFTLPGDSSTTVPDPAATDPAADTGPGKRNREVFQSDDGPVTGHQSRPAPPAPVYTGEQPSTQDPAWTSRVSDARDVLTNLPRETQQQLLQDASRIVSGGHQNVLFIEHATPEQTARMALLDQIRDVVMADLHQNGPESAQETSKDLGKEFGTTRTRGLPGGAPQPAPVPVGESSGSSSHADVDLGEFLNLQMFQDEQAPQPGPAQPTAPQPTATPPQLAATTTLAKANEFYEQLATATFDHPTDGALPIPTQHPEDGCYIRAHLWSQQLREWGVDVKKVFIGRSGNDLVTQSENAFGATKDNPRPVTWRYHVAPLITIDLGNDGPPLEVVLDPAMGKGVVPVRKWIEMAGVTDGFAEGDLYDTKPLSTDQGPLGADETRLTITDARAVSPPWLDSAFPTSFDQASELVRSWHDRTRDYSIEATERQQFRDWHTALPDDTRARFNTMNNALNDAGRRDFHDWFRSLSQQERADFADKLGNDDTTVSDLVPDWDDRVDSARSHLGKLSPDSYATAKNAADGIVMLHHTFPPPGDPRWELVDKITEMVAYRHHTEGFNKAFELSQRLATEHGTTFVPDGTMDLDPANWWAGLDNSLPAPTTGDPFANLPAVPWDATDPNDLSWLDFDPSTLGGFDNPGSTDQLGAPVTEHGNDGTTAPDDDATGHTPTESGPGKRSRDEFEADEPATHYEPPATRPVPEQLVPPSQADVDALHAVVPPGARFTDPAEFAPLINGTRTELGRDVNCVDASLAFHATWHGDPRVAGSAPYGPTSGATAAAEELGYAPELVGRGADGLAEVIDRVTRGGHGSDALVFGFPRNGRGHAWNIVNHHGVISIVDSQAGTVRPAEPGALPDLDRVYAIPLDADNEFITETRTPPPDAPSSSDPYAVAEHERAVRVHELRAAAAAGEEVPVPETGGGKLVPSLGGLRLVGAAVTAAMAAELAAMTGRDVIALVIGPDAEEPEPLRFTPTGRPLPV